MSNNYPVKYTTETNFIGIFIFYLPTGIPIQGREFQLMNSPLDGGNGNIYEYDTSDGKWYLLNTPINVFFTNTNTTIYQLYYVKNVGKPNYQTYLYNYYNNNTSIYGGIVNEITTSTKNFYRSVILDNDELGGRGCLYNYIDNIWYISRISGNIILLDGVSGKKYYIDDIGKENYTIYEIYNVTDSHVSGVIKDKKPITPPIDNNNYEFVINNLYLYIDKWYIVFNDGYYFTDLITLKIYYVNYYIQNFNFRLYELINTGQKSFDGVIVNNIPKENPINGYETQLYYISDKTIYLFIFMNNKWCMINNDDYIFNNKYYCANIDNTSAIYNIYSILPSLDIYYKGKIVNDIPNSPPTNGELFQLINNNKPGGYCSVYLYDVYKWVYIIVNYTNIYFYVNDDKYFIKNVGKNNYEIILIPKIESIYNGYVCINTTNTTRYDLLLSHIKTPEIGDYILVIYPDNIPNNYPKIFKYIGNSFINIDDFWLFYSNNGDVINTYEPCLLIVSYYYKSTQFYSSFDITNNIFSGTYGVKNPDNRIEGTYYLDINKGILYFFLGSWLNVLTTLTKFIYISGSNKYVVYTEKNSSTTNSPILIDLDNNIYQGFYTNKELNDNDDRINEIKNIKLGRNVVNGDSLLYKNNNQYYFYTYGLSEDVPAFNILAKRAPTNQKYIYYDLGCLQILYLNNNIVSECSNYFEQKQSIFDGTSGIDEPQSNTPTDKEYLSYKYFTLYKFYNNEWLTTIKSLYKFNFNNLLAYSTYDNIIFSIYNIYNSNSSKYQGYYNETILSKPTTDNINSQLNLLYILQLEKEDKIEIGDCVLLIDDNGNTYTAKILINDNNLSIDVKDVDNVTFFNVDGNKIYSQIISNNTITQMTDFNLDIDDFNLVGDIIYDELTLLGKTYSRLYLYPKKQPYIEQAINNFDSYPIITNNKYFTFTDNYEKWLIKTGLNNDIIITDVTPPELQPIYQGYYSDEIIEEPSYNDIKYKILELSDLHKIRVGDSLLMSNKIYTIISDSQITNIDLNNSILYYCDNQIGDYKNKILFIDYNVVLPIDNFDNSNKILKGYVDNIPQNKIVDSFYLDSSNFKLYRFIDDIINIIQNLNFDDPQLEVIKNEILGYLLRLMLSGENLIESYTFMYNYNYIDLVNNNTLIININPSNNYSELYNTEGDKYIYNGDYQAYYSNNNIIFNQKLLLHELEHVKQQKAITGDFLLIKINNDYTVYRFNSINPLNITQINLPNKYLYYNLSNKNILLINNNDLYITDLIFDINKKVFNGYMEGIKNKENPPKYNYYIDIDNKLFQTYYNGDWIYTFLGLYIYNYSVNPFFKITNKYINGDLDINVFINVTSVDVINIPNSIIFNGLILLDLPTLPNNGDVVCINNDTYKCGVFIYVNDLGKWAYYNPLPIMKFNDFYIHNTGNDLYFLTSETNFSGIIIKDYNIITQEYYDNNLYKLGDISLLMDDFGNINNGKIYQLSYNPDTLTYPYIWSILCEEQSYFTDSKTCINYFVNNIGINAYIIERHSTNYYIGKLINNGYIENEYYIYNNNICIYLDGELKSVAKNDEPFEFYNLLDSKTYVFNGTLFGLKEYSGYTLKVNNINNDSPSVNYKNNTFCLVYDTSNLNINSQVVIYKKDTTYVQVGLLNKTYYKDVSNGKMYIIELVHDNIGKIIEIVKSKLGDAIISKYINNFDTESKSVNLLKSSSRVFTQNITQNDLDESVNNLKYIKFNPQPPINSKYTENNKCSVVLKNDEWWFNVKDSNVSIIFEYYENGVNYDLMYNIVKHIIKNKILAAATFSGDFNFSEMTEINNQQIMLVTYILDYKFSNNYIADGIINIPENGIYNISAVINYQYDATVSSYVTEAPYYSLNYFIPGYPELIKYLVCITNYNTPSKNLFTPISYGTITINAILDLQKDDQIILIYNLNGCEINIKYLDNSWITLTKIN